MEKRQKSDESLIRKRRRERSIENSSLSIVEDEDMSIEIGKKSNESGTRLANKRKSSAKSEKIKEQNEAANADKDSKSEKRDSRKILKIVKILKQESAAKKSPKLYLYDGLERLFKKFAKKRKLKRGLDDDQKSEGKIYKF